MMRKIDHHSQFCTVSRDHDGHSRNHPQIGQVINTLVGGPICSNQSSSVKHEADRKFLDRDIMDDMIQRALEKSGVDGNIGL